MVQFVNGRREGALRWISWEEASATLSDSAGQISLSSALDKECVARVARQAEPQVALLKALVAAADPNCKWRGQRGNKRTRANDDDDTAVEQGSTAATTTSSSAALASTEESRSAKRSNTQEAGLSCTVS